MDGFGLSSKKVWLQCNIDASIETDWDCSLEDALIYIGENIMYSDVMLETIKHSMLSINKVYSIKDYSRLLEEDFVPGEHFEAKYIYENHKYLAERIYFKINKSNKKLKSFLPFIIGFVGGWLLLQPIGWLDRGIVKLLAWLLGFNFESLNEVQILYIVFLVQIGIMLLYWLSKFVSMKFIDLSSYISKYYHRAIKSKLRGISSGEGKSKTITKVGLRVDVVIQEENQESLNNLKSVIICNEFELENLGQFKVIALDFTPTSLTGVNVFTPSGDLVSNKNVLPYGLRRQYKGNNNLSGFAPIFFYSIPFFHAVAIGFMLIFKLF